MATKNSSKSNTNIDMWKSRKSTKTVGKQVVIAIIKDNNNKSTSNKWRQYIKEKIKVDIANIANKS